MKFHYRNRMAIAGVLVLWPWASQANPITYDVTVNTATVSGTSGFLDFDFAPGPGSQAALVTISNFTTDGSLIGAPQVSGGVAGGLTSALTIDNSAAFNDYFQGLTYGTELTFVLSFSGPALSAPNGTSSFGSTFAFGMFDGTGFNPLLTTDPNGNTFTVDVNLDGTTTPTLFGAGGQSGPAASLIIPNMPEPTTGFLAIFGLAGILCTCAASLTSRHAAAANQRRISARGTTPVFSARMIPRRRSTK